MELYGYPLKAKFTYPKLPPTKILPATSTVAASYKNRIPYQPESISLPWMPNAYYKAAALNPTLAPLSESFPGLPPTKVIPFISERPNGVFTRHTLDDWHRSNMTNYKESETTRHNAERLRADLNRTIKDVYLQAKRTQGESTKNLGERVNDIEYWKSELCLELDAMIRETNSLADMQKRLERALADTEGPFQVAHKCLLNREKRMGIDLVHDDVEKQLITEIKIIRSVRERLQQCLNTVNNQLMCNKEARQELEKDLADKQMGHHIDNKCYQLKNTSRGIHYYKGVERIDATLVQEVNEINETLRNLHQCLRASEDMLQMLVRSKAVLEHDLVVKNNSLFIDQERCMGMRKTYPSTVQILGYVSAGLT
ncbi:hypothetical protein BTVI_21037 [Pitangus sulphuratus]|nr:hypothetical protein BTVI_21037 [Pitangus sulphuratus]